MSKRPEVIFAVDRPECRDTYVCKGQSARCLMALVAAGDRGVTAQELSSWALRLAAYVHDLRRRFGLDIHMEREPHDGAAGEGWHGRYSLLSSVQIIETIHG